MIQLINNVQHNNNIQKVELNNKIIYIKLFNSNDYDLCIKLKYNKLYKFSINCNVEYEIKLDNTPLSKSQEYTINLSNYKNMYIKFKKDNIDIFFDKLYLQEIKNINNLEKIPEKLFLFNDSEYILSDYLKNSIRETLNKNSQNLEFYSELSTIKNEYIFEYMIDNKMNKTIYTNKHLKITPNEIENLKNIIMNYNYANIFFEKIFIINMKDDVFRKDKIRNQMNEYNLEYELYEATNGRETPECQIILNNYLSQPLGTNCHPLEIKLKRKLLKNVGEIGYLFSWKNILNYSMNKYRSIAIFDDDIILSKYFKELAYYYLTNFSFEDYYILNLGSTQYFSQDIVLNKINYKITYYKCNENTDGSFAVGLNYKIYNELLKKINNFNATLDTGCLRDIYLEHENKCYSPYQNLIIAYLGKAGINNKKDIYAYSIKLRWNLENYNWSIFFDNIIDVILLNNSKYEDNYEYINITTLDKVNNEYVLIIYKNTDIRISNLITELINNNQSSIRTNEYFFGKTIKYNTILEKYDIIKNPNKLLEVS